MANANVSSGTVGVAGASESLASMIDRGAGLADVAAYFDALDAHGRVAAMRTLGRPQQTRLWEMARGKTPLDLGTFVDGNEKTIIYEGKNVLPAFSRFQKRFYRGASGAIVGYNHNDGMTTALVGPGYFVIEGADDGEILFDYTRAPAFQPPSWPEIKPNTGLLAGAVYGGMKDYVRYVAKGTIIGAAFKGGKPRNQYFMLTRAAD